MTDAPAAQPTPRRLGRALDLAVAAGLAVVAALLATGLPAGSTLRAAAALPILLLVPGYLLIEATVTSTARGQRALHALVGLGVSPPLVALLALATALLPGGFRSGTIIGLVTLACLALAAVAAWRRLRAPAGPPPAPASQAPLEAVPPAAQGP
ncbi:MAG TPA: DUF1616 domain-containing protein [Candidatus Thermoplasmatota archaeon]|nr:DUF1616 domain-containing protein [Candidatus Thermoplasmatota archaeon]